MQNLIFSASIVTPIFFIISIGYLLKRKRVIDEHFNRNASKIVFNIAMPALVFTKISTTNYLEVLNLHQIIFIYSVLISFYVFSWIVAKILCENGKDQGAFVQGSFRSNFAIIGLALITNAFGISALANAAIILAFIMPLYNILSIIALCVPIHKEDQISPVKTFISILSNPLIIAALIAFPFSYFQLELHPIFSRTINYLAGLTLPMALLSIGGSLSFKSIKKDLKLSAISSFIKIIAMPFTAVCLAYVVGFRDLELGIIFFLFAAPTAIASYIMAEALGSNGELAGNIILMSTLGSVITLTLGLFLMKSIGLL